MKMEAETTKSPHGNGAPSLDTCGICKEVFHAREPKLLPCLHSFCRSCIVPKTNENGIVTCPVCQQESLLGDMIDNVLALGRSPSTSSGEGVNQEDHAVHMCTGCEETYIASSFCTDCIEYLCDQCVQAHRRVRVTKDHTIIPKDRVSGSTERGGMPSPLQNYTYCPRHHQEQLRLFCETCDKLTCRDCQLSDHKDHRYKFVNEASEQYKQFLNLLLGKIIEKQTYMENAKALIKKRNGEIEEREKVVLNDIKNFAKTLMSHVNTRGRQIVADLHSVCQVKKSQLGHKHNVIVNLSSQLDHARKLAENILENNNSAVMLATKKLVVQKLRHLLRTRCEVPNPYHVVDIGLTWEEKDICSQIACQGKLIVDGVAYGSSKPSPASTKPSTRAIPPTQPPKTSKAPGTPGITAGTPGITPGPPNIPNLTLEQRTMLVKQLAAARIGLPPGSGSSSPTSTMTGPNLAPSHQRGMHNTPMVSGNLASSSTGRRPGSYPPMMPQSNKVSSTQVVKTSGVFYPSSTHPPGSSKRRSLTVQEQLHHQRQLHQVPSERRVETSARTLTQERYKAHLAKLRLEKMSQDLRHQQQQHQQQQQQHQQNQGMAYPAHSNNSRVSPIIIQPSSSTGPYHTNHTGMVSPSNNGRDHLTPSPSWQTGPYDSRSDVSPGTSGSDSYIHGYNHGHVSDDSARPSSSRPGIRTEDFSHMIGPDGALCIQPETPTPTSADQNINYPAQDDFLQMIQSDMKEGGLDPTNMAADGQPPRPASGLISDPSVETTQKTPPPGGPLSTNQDQPYNLTKPITDQVMDGDGCEVLDLSTTGGASAAPGVPPAKPVLGTAYIVSKDTTSSPLPLRDPDDPSDDYCAVCHNGGQLLCCDTCPKVFHLTCHVPSVPSEPSGTWSCGLCTRESDITLSTPVHRNTEAAGSKRKMAPEKLVPEELLVCNRILLELFTHEASVPFHDPVPKSVPNYHKIISQPMDLGSVKQRLGRQQGLRFVSIEDYLTDVQLIMSNCTKFNGTESEVGQAGVALEKFFHSLVLKYLPFMKSWIEGAHDAVLQEPKAKRRKRDPSGKDGKDGRPRERGDGDKKERKSPTVKSRKQDKMPVLLPPLSHSLPASRDDTSREAFNDQGMEELGEKGSILGNLGLVRSSRTVPDTADTDNDSMNQDFTTDPAHELDLMEGALDLPSDPIYDPNDDKIDSPGGMITDIQDGEERMDDTKTHDDDLGLSLDENIDQEGEQEEEKGDGEGDGEKGEGEGDGEKGEGEAEEDGEKAEGEGEEGTEKGEDEEETENESNDEMDTERSSSLINLTQTEKEGREEKDNNAEIEIEDRDETESDGKKETEREKVVEEEKVEIKDEVKVEVKMKDEENVARKNEEKAEGKDEVKIQVKGEVKDEEKKYGKEGEKVEGKDEERAEGKDQENMQGSDGKSDETETD